MPNFGKYYSAEKFREMRNEQKKRNYAKTAKYPPKRWTKEEDILVLKHDCLDVELSSKIKRSVRAIQIRRSRLKNGRKEE